METLIDRPSGASAPEDSSGASSPPSSWRLLFTGGGWRVFAYALFVLVRLALYARDQNFPVYDGGVYFEKAAWMGADPFRRAFSSQAFSHESIRPPGPMWLLLPFMVISQNFVAWILGMSLWIVAFVEIGVRALLPASSRLRDLAALCVLASTPLFYTPRDFYMVDPLLTALTLAAVGLAVAWLRIPRPATALGLGVVLALAILTKPAALYLTLGLAVALAGGWTLAWFRHGQAAASRPPFFFPLVRLALFCGVPVTVAVAALFFTDYSSVLSMPEIMKNPNLSLNNPAPPFSARAIETSLESFVLNGGPVFVFYVTAAGALFTLLGWRQIRQQGNARDFAASLIGLVIVVTFILALAGTPVRQPRYLAPATMGLVAWTFCAALASRKRQAVWVLAFCTSVGIGWEILYVAQRIPKAPWVRNGFYSPLDPLTDSKKAFAAFAATAAQRPNEHLSVLTTDLHNANQSFYVAMLLQNSKLTNVSESLHSPKPFYITGPEFPASALAGPLGRTFPGADYLLCVRPDEHAPPMPPNSTSTDWRKLNAILWYADNLSEIGLRELVRTENCALFMTENSPVTTGTAERPLAVRRAQWLSAVDFTSSEAPLLRESLAAFSLINTLSPAGRQFPNTLLENGSLELLMHPEYEGNPFYSSGNLRWPEGYVLKARIAGEKGDGVVLRMKGEQGAAAEVRVVPGQPVEIDRTSVFHNASGSAEAFHLSVEPGPAGDSSFDAVWIGLVRKKQ